MNFYLGQDKYQDFSFIDIEPYQVIQDFRNRHYSGELFKVPFHTAYENLSRENPKDDTLRGHLIEYYFQCYIDYGNEWLIPATEIFQNIQREVMYLDDNQKATAYHYFIMGYIMMAGEKIPEAMTFYYKSIGLDAKDGETYFNLAVAYDKSAKSDSALKYYKQALIYYKDTVQKADAARNVGFIYENSGDYYNAIVYLEMSEKLQYANYYTLRSLLKLYAKHNYPREKSLRDIFFMAKPNYLQIYSDLLAIYTYAGKVGELEKFYREKLAVFKEDFLVTAHLQFSMAELLKDKDKEKSKAYLTSCLSNYKKVLPEKDEQVLLVESILQEFK